MEELWYWEATPKAPAARWVPGGIGLTLSLIAGLTVDHRVADGAHAARLLESFVRQVDGHQS